MTTHQSEKITFSMQEVTKLLLKEKNINSGYYVAHISPNLKGAIVNVAEENDNEEYRQAMIIAFDAVELFEVSKEIPNAVDASKID